MSSSANLPLDTRVLEGLLGYSTKRASDFFLKAYAGYMRAFDLSPVPFAILSLITHNPGITASKISDVLDLRPSNVTLRLHKLAVRGLVSWEPNSRDRRSKQLFAAPPGVQLMRFAEDAASAMERQLTRRLSSREREQLIGLLQQVFPREQ